jgi:ferredoxin
MPIVSIQGTTKTFEVKEGEVIYDALYDRGEELPHGCLSGSCGACRVEVCSGKENLQAPGVIEKNTIEALKDEFTKTKGIDFVNEKEIRLSCRAKVIGDVSITPIK